MGAPGVGGFELDGIGVCCPDDADNIAHRHVPMMGPRIIAPAQVHTHFLGCNVACGVVEGGDIDGHSIEELAKAELAELGVAAHGEIRAIDLEDDDSFGDGLIFMGQSVGQCEEIGFVVGVVIIGEEQRRSARRGSAHESPAVWLLCDGGFERGGIVVDSVHVLDPDMMRALWAGHGLTGDADCEDLQRYWPTMMGATFFAGRGPCGPGRQCWTGWQHS